VINRDGSFKKRDEGICFPGALSSFVILKLAQRVALQKIVATKLTLYYKASK